MNDDWLKNGLPTYQGEKDSAVGRKMIDRLGGPAGFRTDYRTNADGSVTTVQLKGDMPPEITVKRSIGSVASTCAIEMDSGILDIIACGDYHPRAGESGVIYKTTYVAANTSGDQATGAGKLKYPKLEGAVVSDGASAKAFASDFVGGTDYKDRKKLAAHIPASLFTGRTRLYVQSLFGGNWPALVLKDASNGAGRPVLSVNMRDREAKGLQATLIGSGCGIYFDAVNKNHFLIQPAADSANVIPLIGTPCAEKYRLLLRSNTTLSSEDQEKIEAYILSQSFPVPEFTTILHYASTPSEALGYSWHWNWSGNKCDIVDVQEVFIPEDSCYGFTTTHYRLEFSNDGMNLAVTRSVVSNPVTWSVPKHTNVIAYPDWGYMRMMKAGNTPSVISSTPKSAPVYCFYNKDELQVVRVDTAKIPRNTESRTSTGPAHYGGTYPAYITGFLIEQEDGSSTVRASQGETSCFFSAAGASVGGYSGNSSRYTKSNVWWKRMHFTEATGSGTDYDTLSGGQQPTDTSYFDDGVPDIPYTVDGIGRIYPIQGAMTWPNRLAVTGVNWVAFTRGFFCSFWKITETSVTEGRSGKTLIVIPFQDAEAIYLSDQNLTTESGTKTEGEISGIDVWGTSFIDVIFPGTPGYQHYGDCTPLRSTVNSPARGYAQGVTSPYSNSYTTGAQRLVSSNGTFGVGNMPGSGDFYSTANTVNQFYATLSSVNGAVLAEDTGVFAGSNVFPHLSAYLGWA